MANADVPRTQRFVGLLSERVRPGRGGDESSLAQYGMDIVRGPIL